MFLTRDLVWMTFHISLMQVSFLLGVIPVFIAWIYSEFLEYKRSSLHSKVYVSGL